MPKEKIITAIDLGSSKISTIIAAIVDSKISVIGVSGTVPSRGVKKGNVVDIDDAVQAISSSLERAERMAGVSVSSAFVTINADEEGNPFEVFINVGKAGSDITADAEALGRLMSLALRIPSDFPPKQVLKKIVDQLVGIGGASQMGFGSSRVYSMADAIAKVLSEFLKQQEVVESESKIDGNGVVVANGNGHSEEITESEEAQEDPPSGGQEIKEPSQEEPQQAMFMAAEVRRDICPKCGTASFVFEEGCKKCYSCGHSEC